jgi:hypothetical protein
MARPRYASAEGAAQVRAELRRRLSGRPTKQVAYELGLSQPVLSLVMNGHREPSERVAEALGFRRIVVFERVPDEQGRGAALPRKE